MIEEFSQSFSGPASFYELLSVRQKFSPLMLNRLCRPSTSRRKDSALKKLRVTLSNVSCPKNSTLVGCFLTLSISNEGRPLFSWHGLKEFQFNRSQLKTNPMEFAHGLDASKGHYFALLILPSNANVKGSVAMERIHSRFLQDNVESVKGDSDNWLFNIVELLFPKSSILQSGPKSLLDNELVNSTEIQRFRSRVLPVSLRKQTILLSSKVYSGFPSIREERNKLHAAIDFELSWKLGGFKEDVAVEDIMEETSPFAYGQMFVHYVFREGAHTDRLPQSLVEFGASVECPWCPFIRSVSGNKSIEVCSSSGSWSGRTSRNVAALLAHLRSCHVHCKYESIADHLGNLHIIIRRSHKHDLDGQQILQERIAPFMFFSNRKKRKELFRVKLPRLNIVDFLSQNNTEKQLEVITAVKESPEELPILVGKKRFPTTQEEPTKLPVISLVDRQYYHARVGLPMLPNELGYNSEEDVDMEWEGFKADRAIDDFEDVSFEEKEFMKLWNRHIRHETVFSDSYLPNVCESFVRNYGETVLQAHLRHNFLLHMLSLYDFGLLRAEEVATCVADLDKLQFVQGDDV